MTKNPLLYGVLLLVLAVFVTQCCFTVHQTQLALVLQQYAKRQGHTTHSAVSGASPTTTSFQLNRGTNP